MASRRIPYIDYLRGLSVVWVVWFHAVHPDFASFPFRMPLFFFVSGIFFKPYDLTVFCGKKLNQLIVPFIFFYLIYYVFLILLNGFKYHDFTVFDYTHIFDVFGMYSSNESFTVNPPLWFIYALLNLQIITYILSRYVKNKPLMLAISVLISLAGLLYVRHLPTPLMIGRSLPYLIYYVLGNIVGKDIMYAIEDAKAEKKALILGLSVVAAFAAVSYMIEDKESVMHELAYYPLMIGVIMLLILFFRRYNHWIIFRPLMFFGINSYVVLGMHDMYQTIFLIGINNTVGESTVFWGAIQTLCTLLLLYPTILIFNKYIPHLVSKKDLINFPKLIDTLRIPLNAVSR